MGKKRKNNFGFGRSLICNLFIILNFFLFGVFFTGWIMKGMNIVFGIGMLMGIVNTIAWTMLLMLGLMGAKK